MKTVASYASVRAAGTKEFVAPGRAVDADHIDVATGIVVSQGEVVEQVEEPGIEVTHLARTVVAEIVIELVQRFRQMHISAPVNDIEMLARMGDKSGAGIRAMTVRLRPEREQLER